MSTFCCFGDSERDQDPTPNRPVAKPSPEKNKMESKTSASVPASIPAHPTSAGAASLSTANEKRSVFGPAATGSGGPSNAYAPPAGPPPSQQRIGGYQPPPGPPPGHQPQPGGLNNEADLPPPYHNWQEAVPDTSLFPPPPVQSYLDSNTGNASSDDAQRAHDFCDNVPLWKPYKPSPAVYGCVREEDIRPVQPPEYHGDLSTVSKGRWRGSTRDGNGDCLVLTGLPLYFPEEESPLLTERSKTIYFEVKLLGLRRGPRGSGDSSGFSIGFAAQPYPSWRSPGWERGSVGVFSDDGCRFVNDSFGGREFTTEFKVGQTVGLGMTFSLPDSSAMQQQQASGKLTSAVEVFFTRDGKREGSWNLHEEVDSGSGSVQGLEGDFDLYGALGLFGGVDFEVCFDRAGWLWVPQ
ncbi:hypothetical protein FQN54_006868 [Arachnomyces sp. PD_36]|nr:hypothetical protein FQN54_006868 [Arachnomyces sp. PD_36]